MNDVLFNTPGNNFRNRYKVKLLLAFAHGLIFGCIFWVYVEFRYEKGMFIAIRENIKFGLSQKNNFDSIFTSATLLTHQCIQEHAKHFGSSAEFGPIVEDLQSSLIDLNTGIGACGSYAKVLARILQTFGCRVRIGQMLVNGKFGGHIFVEAFNGNKWVVLDPSYGLFFTTRKHELATIEDLQKDWSYFKNQLPQSYKPQYCYQGARYTNWDKIPILLPALHTLLSCICGRKKVDLFCARTIFLQKKKILLMFLLFLESMFAYQYARHKIGKMGPSRIFLRRAPPRPEPDLRRC